VAVVDAEKCKYRSTCGRVANSVSVSGSVLTVILSQLLADRPFELSFLELQRRRVQIRNLKAIIR
jgi:hypothetical protein